MEALLRGNHFRAGPAVFFSVAGMPQRCAAVPLSEKVRIQMADGLILHPRKLLHCIDIQSFEPTLITDLQHLDFQV